MPSLRRPAYHYIRENRLDRAQRDQSTLLPIVFPEVVNGVVPAGGLRVDHDGSLNLASPLQDAFVISPYLVPGTIPAGTHFDSYLFHYDAPDVPPPVNGCHCYQGSLSFSTKIIGLQVFSSAEALFNPDLTPYVGTLEAGDVVVAENGGPPLSYYPRFEPDRGVDHAEMSVVDISGNYIGFNGGTDGLEVEEFRIFVAAVPEPASAALLLLSVLGFVCRRTR